MSFEVRRVRKEDFTCIVQLEIASMGPLWDREKIEYDANSLLEFIEERFDSDRLWVAEAGGKILGFLHSTTYLDAISSTKICEVFTVIVHPEHFGEGIGAALMEYERAVAAEDGVELLKLEVLSRNRRGMNFYDKMGFREKKKVMVSKPESQHPMDEPEITDFPLLDWLMDNKNIRYNLASSSMPAPTLADLTELDGSQVLEVDPEINRRLEHAVQRSYGNDVSVLLTSGTQSANMLAYSVLLRDGDTVVVENPGYAPLGTAPAIIGRSVELIQRRYEDAFVPKINEVPEHASMVVITNPHNPSGTYMDVDSFRPLHDTVKKNKALLLVDEIYRDHMLQSTSAVELGKNVLVTSGLSKVYGLGGLRIGWIASKDHSLMERLRRAKPHLDPFNSVLSERTALALFEDRERILTTVRKRTAHNLSIVKRWISETDGIEWIEPVQGIISFPKLTKDCTSLEFAKKARDHGVLVAPGEYLGMPGHVRLTFRLEPAELQNALAILTSVLAGLK